MGRAVPDVHSVQFYGNDAALISRLRGIVVSGLQVGNSVVIIATPAHREQLVKKLDEYGLDIRAYVRERRFVMADAQEALDSFMVDGVPDANLFAQSIGGLIADAKKAARTEEKPVSAFGEMVAVLWEQGNHEGAIELEAIWAEVVKDSAVQVHCAYPRRYFIGKSADYSKLAEICSLHTHVGEWSAQDGLRPAPQRERRAA